MFETSERIMTECNMKIFCTLHHSSNNNCQIQKQKKTRAHVAVITNEDTSVTATVDPLSHIIIKKEDKTKLESIFKGTKKKDEDALCKPVLSVTREITVINIE